MSLHATLDPWDEHPADCAECEANAKRAGEVVQLRARLDECCEEIDETPDWRAWSPKAEINPDLDREDYDERMEREYEADENGSRWESEV